MLNKRAFTLMELLLVIAILAILAAAAAPTYTEGSREAIEEAKKSNFLNAYKQTVSGANLMMGLILANSQKASGGLIGSGTMLAPNLSLDAKNQWTYKINGKDELRNLNYYVPVKSRVFYSLKGKQFFFSAKIGANQDTIIYYVEANKASQWGKKGLANYFETAASFDQYPLGGVQEIKLGERTLDQVWNTLKNQEENK